MTRRLWNADFAEVWFGGLMGKGFGGRRKPAFGIRPDPVPPANDDHIHGGESCGGDPYGGDSNCGNSYGGEAYGGEPYGGDGIVAADRRARRKREPRHSL